MPDRNRNRFDFGLMVLNLSVSLFGFLEKDDGECYGRHVSSEPMMFEQNIPLWRKELHDGNT